MRDLLQYVKLIDLIALAALIALGVTAFLRKETVWMGILAFVVVLWAVTRIFAFRYDVF